MKCILEEYRRLDWLSLVPETTEKRFNIYQTK